MEDDLKDKTNDKAHLFVLGRQTHAISFPSHALVHVLGGALKLGVRAVVLHGPAGGRSLDGVGDEVVAVRGGA